MQRAGVRAFMTEAGRLSVVMSRLPLAARLEGRRPSPRRLLPVAVLGAALALSACQTQSPIQTDVAYQPADGVPVDLGQVQIRDLVIVSGGKDKAGTLSGAVSNTSNQEARIAFALPQAQPVYTTAAPHSEARLTGDKQLQLPAVPTPAGSTVTLTVQSPTAPTTVVVVPVVAANHYYATLAPTPQPSGTATPSATATP